MPPANDAAAQTLGILGGGQLGRMLCMAARPLGLRTLVVDAEPNCCAAVCADVFWALPLSAPQLPSQLAQACRVVTYENEQLALTDLEALAAHNCLHPSLSVLGLLQDRHKQKSWLAGQGMPLGRFAPIQHATDIVAQLAQWYGGTQAPRRSRLKTCQGGYDGRSQRVLHLPTAAAAAHASLGSGPCVLEEELDLAAELSVLVARRANGAMQVYPPAYNITQRGVLRFSQLPAAPAQLHAKHCQQAQALAQHLAVALQLVGLLAVEFFITQQDVLLVNELAARPHNTYHSSLLGSRTSQFEQLVRAVWDWPLGAVDCVQPVALANLLGDLWWPPDGAVTAPPCPPNWSAALSDPHVSLHLYGKTPRPGRKMGHLLATGAHPAAALQSVQAAHARLRG